MVTDGDATASSIRDSRSVERLERDLILSQQLLLAIHQVSGEFVSVRQCCSVKDMLVFKHYFHKGDDRKRDK